MENIKEVISSFDFDGEYIGCEPIGMGHINDTYALSFMFNGKVKRYILQRLNGKIFQDLDGLMNNVKTVSDFLREVIQGEGGDTERECLHFLLAKSGKPYYIDSKGECWRTYVLVEDAEAYMIAEDTAMFEDAGRAFGTFIKRLDKFNASGLIEVIPDFHNTQKRFRHFEAALDIDFKNRSLNAKQEIEFVLKRKDYCGRIVEALADKALPLRVTHNDTKYNNVLIDNNTKKAICIIDLDTIMPGSLLYDFGDAIRSGCSTALEDEKDLSKVHFDINLFEHFCRGFLKGLGKCITKKESDMLAFSAILMTYECGMRFLDDYLSGDTYFKTSYDEHNLVRCRTQFRLVEEMEEQLDEMNKIVAKYSKA